MFDQINQFAIPEALLIHYERVDQQHQSLVDTINDCVKIWNTETHGFEHFEDLCLVFLDKLQKHFTYEEFLMKKTGYGDTIQHIGHHAETLFKFNAFLDTSKLKGQMFRNDIHFCFDSIIMDIAKADLHFDEYLIGKKLKNLNPAI